MRKIAEQKRDERVYELWKKDTEAPTVQEMISKLRDTKGNVKRPTVAFDCNSTGNMNSNESSQERIDSASAHRPNISILS